jgi:hypothetical protein
MIIFLLFFFSLAQANEENLFKPYEIVYKDGYPSYGYSFNKICVLMQNVNTLYASVEDAYSFQKSSLTRVITTENASIPLNCFSYNGYSYIIYRTLDHKIHIIRGRTEKSFLFPIEISNFYYDHLQTKLYFITEKQELYRFNLDMFEEFWTGKLKYNITLNDFYSTSGILVPNYSDFMIYNDTMYRIDRLTYNIHVEKFNDNRQLIDNLFGTLGRSEFRFVLFPSFQNLMNHFITHNMYFVKISQNSPMFVLPPMPNANENGILNVILYLISFVIIIVAIYISKFFLKKQTIGINKPLIMSDMPLV